MEYKHGGNIYGKDIDLDFSVNINPLGMPEGSRNAAIEGVFCASQYPDYACTELRENIAQKKKIDKNKILVGNGAAELIFALCQSIRPRIALAPAPCFEEYERGVLSVGGQMNYVPLSREKEFVVEEDFLFHITPNTDMVFLCNPNNPTGKLISRKLMLSIVEKCEKTNTYLCVDECFLPFVPEEREYTLIGSGYPHVIVLRAFTKIYGMPGLRLGYGVLEDEELLRRTRMVLQPWNVSVPAQMAGVAALQEEDYIKKTHGWLEKEREFLKRQMEQGLAKKVYDSRGNFLLFEAEHDLARRFLEKKVLIRDCSSYPNLEKGFFRICVGGHKENVELLQRWREI